MKSNDYSSRVSLKMAQAIARISHYKCHGQFMQATSLTSKTLKEVLGMNPKVCGWFSHRDLMGMVSPGEVPDPEVCLLLARLLMEQGELDELRGDERGAYVYRTKSMDIYLECMSPPLSEQVPPAYRQETEDLMDELVAKLDAYELPPQTLLLMLRFHEAQGNYADAEDVLFELLEHEADEQERDEWVQIGLSFYHRLLEKSVRELNRGGLPREEVLQSMQELKER